MDVTRRGFVMGCSTAIAGLAGSRFNTIAFGDQLLNQEMLLVIFLRGGIDGLSLVPPIAGADRGHYEAARPNLQILTSGAGAALDLNGQFGLQPAAMPLFDLYQDGKLAIVQAVGMIDVVNKYHFDAHAVRRARHPGRAEHLHRLADPPSDDRLQPAAGDDHPGAGGRRPAASLAAGQPGDGLTSPTPSTSGPWNWRDAQKATLRETGSRRAPDRGLARRDSARSTRAAPPGCTTPAAPPSTRSTSSRPTSPAATLRPTARSIRRARSATTSRCWPR